MTIVHFCLALSFTSVHSKYEIVVRDGSRTIGNYTHDSGLGTNSHLTSLYTFQENDCGYGWHVHSNFVVWLQGTKNCFILWKGK